MSVVARMRFKSVEKPQEYGALVLNEDGTFQIVPSDELRDEMARLEEVALQRSKTYGTRLGIILLSLGALAVGAGWLLGRLFGQLGYNLGKPRPLSDVGVTHTESGGVKVAMQGGSNRFQVVQMAWNGDEVLQNEAEEFVRKFEEMKGGQ